MFKLIFTLFLVSFSFLSLSQFDITYEKLGDLTLDVNILDVEKLCGTTFNAPIDEFEAKFNATLKGNTYEVTFQEKEVEKMKIMVLQKISTKDPKFKTKDGAKVGMSKTELLSLYKNYYSYQMRRSMDEETWNYSTTKLVFDIDKRYNQKEVDFEDFSEYRILFYIENDIVTEIAIMNGYFI
jgi:hypothetical protein